MDSRLLFLLGVTAAILFFYLLYNLINRDEHPIMGYFLLMLIITIGLFLPKSIMDTRTECTTEIMNETTTGNLTTYNYGQFCTTNTEETPYALMNIIYWSYILLMAYVLFSTVFKTLKAIVDLRVRKR